MNTPGTRSIWLRQQGFVSVIAVLALILVVAVILRQSVQISATKALSGQQQSDSVAALAQAQSGSEIAIQKFSVAFNANPTLSAACAAGNMDLTTENINVNSAGGPASFLLLAAKASVNGYCKIRVQGKLRAASRTIETWIKAKVTYGSAGFGTTTTPPVTPTLQLTNPWSDVNAIGLFNTGWAVQSSDGQTVTGNADCTDCQSNNPLWYTTLKGGGNDIGGAGNYSGSISPLASASYQHTVQPARNFAMVGHVLGGSAIQAPTTLGSLSGSNNNNDQGTTTTTTVKANTNWCATDTTANAMVIGVSAKGPGITNGLPNLTGQYTSAKFTYNSDATGPGINVAASAGPSKNYVHYPDATVNDGLSTPIAWGDVFVELYYFYQPSVTITVTGSSGAQLTLSQTYATSLAGRYLQPGGKIPDATYIQTHTAGTNLVTLNQAPTSTFSASTPICTGICGFFPTSNNTSMTFTFGKAAGTVGKAWVSGITCLKGVDDSKVQPVTSPSGVTVFQWHEVLSTDTALF
jgi:hypothetical protein